MAIKGYTFYLDGVKQNIIPQGSPTYTFTGLASNSRHTIDVEVVDYANNVSTPGELDASTSAFTPGSAMSDIDKATVDSIITPRVSGNTGAIVGIIGPKGEYYKAYGSAFGRELTLDDKMRWGSNSKMATATLILREIEAGHLSLDSKLGDFAIGAGIRNSSRITIRNLLEMRSGILDYLNDDMATGLALWLNPGQPYDPINVIRTYSPHADPGFDGPMHYSNSNYYLMGRILEELDATYGTGRTYRQIANEDFYSAAGIVDGGVPADATMTDPHVRGEMANYAYAIIQSLGLFGFLAPIFVPGVELAARVERTRDHPLWSLGTGDALGNIYDFVKFGKFLLDGGLLSPEMQQLRLERMKLYLTYPPTPVNGPGWAGEGLGLFNLGQWYGWRGGTFAYNTTLMFNPTNGAVIATMTNDYFGTSYEDFLDIRYALFPETIPLLPTIVRVNSSPDSPTASGIPSGETFGEARAYVYHTPGDADGKSDAALKVPFYI